MIICIETSGEVGSVALADNAGNCIKKLHSNAVNAHAEEIPVLVAELIEFAESQGDKVSAVAVNKGPGSYTGLRIGASLAKGLCFGFNIPLIACDGLAMMAQQASESGFCAEVYICVMDARRDEVFYSVYNRAFSILKPLGAMVLSEEAWSEYRDKNVVFCGNAVTKLKNLVPAFRDFPGFTETLDASWFCKNAAHQFENHIWADVAYFEPDYGKAFYTGTSKK